MTEILLVAGDPSGDQHAADVVKTLKRKLPSARFVGLGGKTCSDGIRGSCYEA